MFAAAFAGHGCCSDGVVVHVCGDCANILVAGIYADNAENDVAEPGLFNNHTTQ